MMKFGELEITIKAKEFAPLKDVLMQAMSIAKNWKSTIDLEIIDGLSISVSPDSTYDDLYEKWILTWENNELKKKNEPDE